MKTTTVLADNLVGFVVGVKFRPNWAIEDKLGQIIDEILYSKDSSFNFNIFPRTNAAIGQKTLVNEETGDQLTVNRTNIVLDINFSEQLTKGNMDKYVNEFLKVITEKVYKIVDIHEVFMLGFVNKYIIKDKTAIEKITGLFDNAKITDINSLNISFTKKILLAESKAEKSINDFESVIHTIVKPPTLEEFLLHIDYQHYFEPKLDSIIDLRYGEILARAKSYNNTNMQEWIYSKNA